MRNNIGTVIVLNGPSSAGKSSIQKEFQKLMILQPTHQEASNGQILWIKVGIDNLFDSVMPEITTENMTFWQSPNPIRWVESKQDKDNNPVIPLFVGEQGEKAFLGMNSAIAAYARAGCNVIVDYIAYKSAWFDDLRNKLSGIKTYYVAVDIPLDILEVREAARGTSPKGHARSHYFDVYGNGHYDLRVNSATSSAHDIAVQLQKLIK